MECINKTAILLLGFISQFAMASMSSEWNTNINFVNLTPNVSTVFYGEQATISLLMYYNKLEKYQIWYFPPHVSIDVHTPLSCPPFFTGSVNFLMGICHFSLIIHGKQMGQFFDGSKMYFVHVVGKTGWRELNPDLRFSMAVIPHPLSMANIPPQNATANLPVYLDLRPYVNYYSENVAAAAWPIAEVEPASLDGLHYDANLFALVGRPTRIGNYQFKVKSRNDYGQTMATDLNFEVAVNPQDKPVFNQNVTIASAIPGQSYQLDLKALIEPESSFIENNPLRFRIDPNESHPSWLVIAGIENNFLMGQVPLSDAGAAQSVTVIASSNTGGDSLPLTIHIPIASDPGSRPVITPFTFENAAGIEFEYDVRKHIKDPANDTSLKLIIDKVEPEAPWLQLAPTNPTALLAKIPLDATGKIYEVSLHANTRMGGNSETIKASLRIAQDKEKKPRFKAANPRLPIAYPGLAYEHDFVASRDIFPDYEEAPYHMELAKGYDNPAWLRIENNKLIADLVPEDLRKQISPIYLYIRNTPGGRSELISILFFAMIELQEVKNDTTIYE